MYLQKATDAKRCYGTILNVATEFNGNRGGPYLSYDVPCMIDFMERFYAKCGVDPREVEYLEAYGCGLKVHSI